MATPIAWHASGIVMDWRPVSGFESTHDVSRCGKIRVRKRKAKTGNGFRNVNERIVSGTVNSHGYLRCNLTVDGVGKGMYIHKMVADAFCPKPDAATGVRLVVNHKDHNKQNNSAENLEWVTDSDNSLKRSRHYSDIRKRGQNVLPFDLEQQEAPG